MTFEPSIATNEDITMSEENADTRKYTTFFGEINCLVEEAERQYSVGNRTYTEYIIKRLQYATSVCCDLLDNMRGVLNLEDYNESVNDLIDCLNIICKKWEEYVGVLDSFTQMPSTAYKAACHLEYLFSLSFKWNEIAVLLGVSRMLIYR